VAATLPKSPDAKAEVRAALLEAGWVRGEALPEHLQGPLGYALIEKALVKLLKKGTS
jgi:hypothetical protein